MKTQTQGSNKVRPNTPNKRVSKTPEPQKVRVKARWMAGTPKRQIAREEGIDRKTVEAIVREPDVLDHIRILRERYYGIGDAAIDAIIAALREKKDGHLGQRILEAMGVAVKHEHSGPPNMDVPSQDGYNRVAFGIANILLEGNKNFGIDIGDGVIEKMVEEAHEEEATKKKA
jgi:hypothetical protein